jgi:hypothetical protein
VAAVFVFVTTDETVPLASEIASVSTALPAVSTVSSDVSDVLPALSIAFTL